jgi:hypothetical protein
VAGDGIDRRGERIMNREKKSIDDFVDLVQAKISKTCGIPKEILELNISSEKYRQYIDRYDLDMYFLSRLYDTGCIDIDKYEVLGRMIVEFLMWDIVASGGPISIAGARGLLFDGDIRKRRFFSFHHKWYHEWFKKENARRKDNEQAKN